MDSVIIATTLIIALFGVLANNRLAHWRDRRREFNDLSKPIYDALRKQSKTRYIEKVPIDVESFIPYISTVSTSAFRKHVTRYTNSNYHTHDYNTANGEVTNHTEEIDKLMQDVQDLIPYFEPR